jgi:hypothetical protein
MRFDLYGFVHKAQRYHLFRLGQDIGRADLSSDEQRRQMASETSGWLEELRDHARNEETYIHPLFAPMGHEAERIRREHDELDAKMGELGAIMDEARFADLYLGYTRFLGEYLLHIDGEERAQKETLWPNYSDEELVAVFNRFQSERASSAARKDLARMLPALTVSELATIFCRMKRTAPTSLYQEASELALHLLDPSRWTEVELLVARMSRGVEPARR